jgi:cytochrome c peroxidase
MIKRGVMAVAALLAAGHVAADTAARAPLGLPPLSESSVSEPIALRITLGRKLFMDRRLSPNATMSCAMCHIPEQGYTANEMATAVGFEGRSVRRNAPTLLNVGYQQDLFHDGRESRLEAQAWAPLLAHNEMANGSREAVIGKLKSLADYRGLFEQAFGYGPSGDNIGMALAAYQRSLVSGNSRFDRWYFGNDATALSEIERRGFQVFLQKGCAACHIIAEDYALFTDRDFHRIGAGRDAPAPDRKYRVQLAPGVFIDTTESALASVSEQPLTDEGRFEVTRDPRQRFAYKTPSLRNVALSAPYMHDGSMATLDEVVEFYDRGGVPLPREDARLAPRSMSAEDKRALVAFLRSLTGDNVEQLAREARAAFQESAHR